MINFYTCCNKIYNNFIPLFILSNLYHNENCYVEVGTDDVNFEPIQKSINFLKEKYPNKFLIKLVEFDTITINGIKYQTIPNTVRFFTIPQIKTDYVYISDIDIITLEKNIVDIHINNMKRTNLPYSNIVRPLSNKPNEIKRLSGLHFTPFENYYPIPNFEDLCKDKLLNHDEGFLYKIVEKRYDSFNYNETFRPVHGIHISPNREPNGNLGWGLNRWKKEWLGFRNSDIFLEFEQLLPNYIKNKIDIIDNHYK